MKTVELPENRRDQIDELLREAANSFVTKDRTAAANVLALLEIADAIDRLAAVVAFSGSKGGTE